MLIPSIKDGKIYRVKMMKIRIHSDIQIMLLLLIQSLEQIVLSQL